MTYNVSSGTLNPTITCTCLLHVNLCNLESVCDCTTRCRLFITLIFSLSLPVFHCVKCVNKLLLRFLRKIFSNSFYVSQTVQCVLSTLVIFSKVINVGRSVWIAVDPRFKLAPFDLESTRHKAVAATVALMEHAHESTKPANDVDLRPEDAGSASVPSSVNVDPTLQTTTTSPSTSDLPSSTFIQSLNQQLATYTSESNIPRSECPLSWWADNQRKYPLIAEVARRLLSIPATTVSSKRLYTKECEAVLDRRDGLSPDKAELVLFIMENLNWVRCACCQSHLSRTDMFLTEICACSLLTFCNVAFSEICCWTGDADMVDSRKCWLDTACRYLVFINQSSVRQTDIKLSFSAFFDDNINRVTTCLENLEMSGNLTAVGESRGF